MGVRLAVVVSVLTFTAAGCGSDDPQAGTQAPPAGSPTPVASPSEPPPPDEEEAALMSDLSKLAFTEAVMAYSGQNLPLDEYTRQVNTECRRAMGYVTDNPKPPDSAGGPEISKWVTGVIGESRATYQRIAALRPPAEREAEVRAGFLTPYFDQLNAAERLYIDVIGGGNPAAAESVVIEAQEAKKQLTIYAAKNDLTDCIG
jgi:hypothetical protein